MSVGTGLAALFVGAFLMIVGMYAWASNGGQVAFFAGLSLAMSGAAIAFRQAGRRRR